MGEYRGFIFAIMFIIIFAGLVSSIPSDLYGQGNNPDIITPVDPSLVSGFSASVNFNGSDLTGPVVEQYEYNLGGLTWRFFSYPDPYFQLGSKVLIGGVLWLGQLDSCKFISPSGEDYGGFLTPANIEADAEGGEVRYALHSIGSGVSRGGLVFYWNTTTYSNPEDAMDADALYILHGIGIEETARMDIGSLLIALLLLQLPDCPLLINLLLATPLYGAVIYLIWFIIKETLPFV